MNVSLQVTKSRKDSEVVAHIQGLSTVLLGGVHNVARQAETSMKVIIKHTKTREGSEGRLENAIRTETETTGKQTVFGVGHIPTLNREAPYWALQNYGGMVHPQARFVPGVFGPGDAPDPALSGPRIGRQKFTYLPNVGGGSFGFDSRGGSDTHFMKVNTPVEGMHYIEQTIAPIKRAIQALVSLPLKRFYERRSGAPIKSFFARRAAGGS